MFLLFSVPATLRLNQPAATDVDANGDIKMETTHEQEQKPRRQQFRLSAVDGSRQKALFGIVSAEHAK
jgi:hypothetical protein